MRSALARWVSRHDRVAVLIPLGLALQLRSLGIVSRPIWYDEAFAVLFAEKGPAAMLLGTLAPTGLGASDIHPLGYYTLLWLWMRAFGESLISVRALSIMASLATVAVIFCLARELFNALTGLAAGVFAALSPFQVHYGQEIRMYSFLALWLALATYCYFRGARSRRWLWWLGFAAFSALGQYTHNLAAFYLLALAIWPLLTGHWRTLGRVAVASLAAVLLYLPWLVNLPAQFTKVSQVYWIARPAPYRLLMIPLTFVTNLPLQPWQLAIGLLAALSIVAISGIETAHALHRKDADAESGLWMLYLGFAPPLIMFLFSQWRPVYLERGFLPSASAFGIWVAWAVMRGSGRRPVIIMAAVLLTIGFSVGIVQHLAYKGFPYAPYAELNRSLESRLQLGDVIVHSSKLSFLPAVFYDRQVPGKYVGDPPGSGQDTLAPSTQRILGLQAAPDIAAAVGEAGRVWFIIFHESDQEYIRAGYAGHPQLEWLRGRYTAIDLENWGDLDVYLFVPMSGMDQ